MTDGPTGIQVAPITEDDMNKVTSILKRAADAIVGMSQLAADVDMLRQTVTTLQQDCERLRNQNNALDEALAHSRSVRDAQSLELSNAKGQLAQLTQERDDLKSTCTYDGNHINELLTELDVVKKERDQWADEADRLTKAHEAAQAKLDTIHTALGLTPQAMQAPPEMKPVIPEDPEPIAQTPAWLSEPSPVAEPTPAPPVEPETSAEWKSGFYWDASRQLYVKH